MDTTDHQSVIINRIFRTMDASEMRLLIIKDQVPAQQVAESAISAHELAYGKLDVSEFQRHRLTQELEGLIELARYMTPSLGTLEAA